MTPAFKKRIDGLSVYALVDELSRVADSAGVSYATGCVEEYKMFRTHEVYITRELKRRIAEKDRCSAPKGNK